MSNIQSKENIDKSSANTEFIKNVAIKRFITLMLMNLSISFVLGILIQLLFYIRYEAIILLSAALIFFIINTARFSRWFYLSVMGNSIYYKTTFVIHFIFAVINILCYVILPNIVYSWIFLLPKFLKFILPGCPDILSIAAFHGLLFLTTLISTSAVKWIVIEESTAPKLEKLNTEEAQKEN